tara:strand:+ start:766 stop:1806 length:1041 start_codon:yes stop_codon:yes gene_type:complete
MLTLLATPGLADTRPAVAVGKLKVFILAGQSNMQGHGHVDAKPDSESVEPYLNGTLEFLTTDARTKHEFGKLKNNGTWVARDDVLILYNDTQTESTGGPGGAWMGKLSPGFAGDNGKDEEKGSVEMGPELGIGWALGDGLDGTVLLLKTAWGGKDLYEDFRPPSSGGKVGPFYTRMILEVKTALAHLHTLFPTAPADYELAGFFWHQGWNDACGAAPDEYKDGLPNLIKDVRTDLGVPKLPFTVGVSGMGGYRPYSDTQCTGALDVLTDTIIPAQFSVANATLHPEFAGTVTAVETRDFHREAKYSPGSQCYHWNNNCESYWRVGQAMGAGMLKLLGSEAVEVQAA